jgi:hypothetical protein
MNLRGLRRDAEHTGWIRALLARLTARLQTLLGVQVFRVNLRPMPRRPLEPVPPEGIRLCALRLEQLLEAAADPELGLDPDFIRAALERGDVAFGAYEGNRLIGYNWRAANAVPFLQNVWVKIGHRYHYAYKSFVRPSYRGRRIHTAITRLADRYSMERGCVGEIGIVNIANLASLGAAKSLGRRKVGYAGCVTLFGHCASFRTRGVRELGIELYRPQAQAPIGLEPARG